MKRLFLMAICAGLFTACQNNSNNTEDTSKTTSEVALVDAENAPKVTVEKSIFEFGEITQGEKVSYDFKFKNTGKTPLIITDASATCGCTVPEYPKTPIKPGESGTIKVIFDSTGKLGLQDKVVTITSNANPRFEDLHVVGNIIEKK